MTRRSTPQRRIDDEAFPVHASTRSMAPFSVKRKAIRSTDDDYRRLEALLAADLEAGYRVVRLDGHLFVRSDNRWRPARLAPVAGEASWERGVIVSRNFGRVIVPPFIRDGEIVPGYTRNGPGEGPSEPRSEPITMRCLDRPLQDERHYLPPTAPSARPI